MIDTNENSDINCCTEIVLDMVIVFNDRNPLPAKLGDRGTVDWDIKPSHILKLKKLKNYKKKYLLSMT
jgi:hypothetical protein